MLLQVLWDKLTLTKLSSEQWQVWRRRGVSCRAQRRRVWQSMSVGTPLSAPPLPASYPPSTRSALLLHTALLVLWVLNLQEPPPWQQLLIECTTVDYLLVARSWLGHPANTRMTALAMLVLLCSNWRPDMATAMARPGVSYLDDVICTAWKRNT